MARLVLKALRAGGHDPRPASRLRTLDLVGDPGRQRRNQAESAAESARLIRLFADPDQRPEAWVTYHVYYKAPDWIGPDVSAALGIPYVIVEGSRSPKRADGPWSHAHAAAEAALDRAGVVLYLTEKDRGALERFRPPHQRLMKLPPFLDAEAWPDLPRSAGGEIPRLLTVAMMRPGDKLTSYRLLAESLAVVDGRPWTLDIVGDGIARRAVEEAFARFEGRVLFHGLVEDRATLAGLYARADLFVWPAVNEAFGMVFLEAQACGVPVVAGRFGGTADVILHGKTGLIVDPADLGRTIAELLPDAGRLQGFSDCGRRFVREERTVAEAARILDRVLGDAQA